jgi:glycosyltransferase involved in cell wall biosynthesis
MLDSSLEAAASGRTLRIAQIAPLYESVPPKLYGGTERVIAWLVEALSSLGHSVTLFASGDSTVGVTLEAGCAQSLRLAGLDGLGPAFHLPMLSEVYDRADEFDIVHSHLEHLGFPFAHLAEIPTISTMHGRVDLEDLKPIYDRYDDLPLVSISQAQSDLLPNMNWMDTIYHGLPCTSLYLNPNPGKYLAFLGRLSPEKRPEIAIEIAQRAGIPLKIAAKVDRINESYFNAVIKPLLACADVEYVGEISELQKQEFLGNALALIFPIDWPEPFGLVMIEALACGTPVIARPFGSVPEVLREGVSGFIESDVDGLVSAAKRASSLSRRACREEFEARFTAEIMATRYEALYYRLIQRRISPDPLANPALASVAK